MHFRSCVDTNCLCFLHMTNLFLKLCRVVLKHRPSVHPIIYIDLFVKVKVKVKVTLRLTVSQSVCLGVEPKYGTFDQRFFFFGHIYIYLSVF
jgi:hypothetical protein